jgi:hypothetical protein
MIQDSAPKPWKKTILTTSFLDRSPPIAVFVFVLAIRGYGAIKFAFSKMFIY